MPNQLYISSSQAVQYQMCPRALQYRKVMKWEAEYTGNALVNGSVVDEVVNEFLIADALRDSNFDLQRCFDDHWSQRVERTPIALGNMSLTEHRAICEKLCLDYPAFWKATGHTVLLTNKGQPAVQFPFDVPLGRGVRYRGWIDLIALTSDGRVAVIDNKTMKQRPTPDFVFASDQLTGYDYAVRHPSIAMQFDVDGADCVGFIEMMKRKVGGRGLGPEITMSSFRPASSTKDLADWQDEMIRTAYDIDAGRFPKRSLMAFNTPCQLCDYSSHCLHDSLEGIVRPEDKTITPETQSVF